MPARPAYTDLIFDFDGTLVDSAPAILATFAQILKEAAIPPAVPLDQSLIGPPLIPTLQKIAGSDDSQLTDRLAARFKHEYDTRNLPLTTTYAGALETLTELQRRGLALHIATNKRESPTLCLLDLFGWRHFFASVHCIDSTPGGFRGKAEMLRSLLSEQDVPPDSAVFVGDTASDEEAAKLNGIAFVAATWGYGNWPRGGSRKNCLLIHCLAELPALVADTKPRECANGYQ